MGPSTPYGRIGRLVGVHFSISQKRTSAIGKSGRGQLQIKIDHVQLTHDKEGAKSRESEQDRGARGVFCRVRRH